VHAEKKTCMMHGVNVLMKNLIFKAKMMIMLKSGFVSRKKRHYHCSTTPLKTTMLTSSPPKYQTAWEKALETGRSTYIDPMYVNPNVFYEYLKNLKMINY
jgi:hypothetical protein